MGHLGCPLKAVLGVPMRFAPTTSLLLWAAAFAGCLDGGTRGGLDDAQGAADALVNSLEGYVDPFLMNHDHSDVALHQLSFHMEKLAHHPLGGNLLKSSGAHVVDAKGDWLFVGAYGLAADVDGGLWVFDITNPAQPRLTGQFRMAGNVGGDRSLEATEDANWVVLGTEAITCGNHLNPFLPGLYLLDVRDKANPKLADYVPDTGVHSVMVHRVAGKDYVVTLGADAFGKNIREIDAGSGKFKEVGVVPIAHDGTIADDPALGHPVLYVANVDNLQMYDFSDPSKPVRLGSWSPPAGGDHYVHAVAVDWVEGRRILAVESEDWTSAPSPLWILDATDFADLELLATWTNPAGAPANAKQSGSSLAFSTHNPRLENGTVYMAHYHGGVWALDVRTLAKARAPEVMGYYLPHEDHGGYRPQSSSSLLPLPAYPICEGGFQFDESPNTMDVEVRNGIVYAADIHTGLYALRWDPKQVPGATAPDADDQP